MARNRWLKVAGTAAALALTITAFGWARGGRAKGEVVVWPDSAPPPSAGLLRRLAESADAFRTGRIVYVVIQDSGYYTVAGGFSTLDSAVALARANGPTWRVYSTRTSSDIYSGGSYAQVILPGCYKDTRTTLWVCPPKDSLRAPIAAMRLQDVLRIEVTFYRTAGKRTTVRMDPEHAGATIYTLQDFDRFIVPYYTRLYGPAQTARMRDDLINFVRRSLDSATAPPPR